MSGLFGPEVTPVAPPPTLRALADRLPDDLRIGTSSWSFPGWAGLVWHRSAARTTLAREGLSAYGQHPILRAVGVDRTYYAPIQAKAFADYAKQVPDDFRFLVKAHQHLTLPRFQDHPRHGARAGAVNPRFLDVDHAMRRVVEPVMEGLGDRLGVLLLQLPPLPDRLVGGPAAFAERLDAFLGALPDALPVAVEVRTPSLLTRAYARVLVRHRARHSYVVHPRMPPVDWQIRRVPGGARHGLVVRWMLQRGHTYDAAKRVFAPFDALAAPDPDSRSAIARLCALALERAKPVLVIINNKAEGSAPLSAFALAEDIADRLERTGSG